MTANLTPMGRAALIERSHLSRFTPAEETYLRKLYAEDTSAWLACCAARLLPAESEGR